MFVRPRDTDAEAWRAQMKVYERPGKQGRARLTGRLNHELRERIRAGVRRRHPEYSEEEVRLAAFRLTAFRVAYGDELYLQVYGRPEVLP